MTTNKVFAVAMAIQLMIGVPACSPAKKDISIKSDLTAKAKTTKEFSGVVFRVENSKVILSGVCPTEKARQSVVSTIKGVHGVKDVVDNIRIAPVVIGTDLQLKQAVDSVLTKYASVEAVTRDSVVSLSGKIENDQLEKLTTEIESLKPRMILNDMTSK